MDNRQENEIKHQFIRLASIVRDNGGSNGWLVLFCVLMLIRGCTIDSDLFAANKKLDAILGEMKAKPVVVDTKAVEVEKVK